MIFQQERLIIHSHKQLIMILMLDVKMVVVYILVGIAMIIVALKIMMVVVYTQPKRNAKQIVSKVALYMDVLIL